MSDSQLNNPLHGVILAMILTHLVERYGWEELGRSINIRCFNYEPGIKSSLKFLHCRIPTIFIQYLLNIPPQVLVAENPLGQREAESLYLRSLGPTG